MCATVHFNCREEGRRGPMEGTELNLGVEVTRSAPRDPIPTGVRRDIVAGDLRWPHGAQKQ